MGQISPATIARLEERARRFPGAFHRGFTAEAVHAHSSCMIIDLHADPMLQWCFFRRDFAGTPGRTFAEILRSPAYHLIRAVIGGGKHKPLFDHTDVPRMRLGGVDAAVFGLHWYPQDIVAAINPWDGVSRQLDHLAALNAAGSLRLVRSSKELIAAVAAGAFAACSGIEGWHALGHESEPLGLRLQRLDLARAAGAVYLTLNHHTDNDAAHNSWSMLHQDSVPDPNLGLGPAGPAVIERCNKLGVIVDLTHTNHRCILEACEHASAPVIASHGGSRAPSRTDRYAPRVLDLDCIIAIARTGGGIGVPFCPAFLVGSHDASVTAVVTDLNRIKDTIDNARITRTDGTLVRGEECVCLGTDFDGWIPSIPQEVNGVEDLPLLTQLLLDQGWGAEAIGAMYGGNFLRIWDAAANAAARM